MVDQNSQFYAILTAVGAAKQANADALGIAWKITQMAVGDGNPGGLENPPLPMPDASARALLNEWRRAPLNQLKVDDKDSSIIVAEQVIPADVGGRWIREMALFDADGDMVAVANCAPTYKPLLSQGSGRTQVVRMNLVVSSSSNVQLKIDPSVVLATREWVTEELAKQDFKHSVLAATTAAIVLSGLQTIDGVALTAGARVLVKNQAAAKDNGLYQVVAGGPWVRCADADTSLEVTPGLLVMVERGAANGDSVWQLVTDAPITLGVTALVFEMAIGRTGVAENTYRSVTVDKYGRVVGASNPTTLAGYGIADVYNKTQIDQAFAPLSKVGSASGFEELSSARAITAADAGKTFLVTALGVVITFPNSTSLAGGFEVTILAAAGASFTLAGSTFTSSRGAAVLSGNEGFAFRVLARKTVNNYRVLHCGDGTASLLPNGYEKKASGLIDQWGSLAVGPVPPGAVVDYEITLPVTFPSYCASVWGVSNANSLSISINRDASKLAVQVRNITANSGSGSVFWGSKGY